MTKADHSEYVEVQTQAAKNIICPFVDRYCDKLCHAFIKPTSYTVKEDSTYGHKSQIKQCKAGCKLMRSN